MVLSALQRRICQLLAESRRRAGDSYVAGGAALGEVLKSDRLSRDLDLFHDDDQALARAAERDLAALSAAGFVPTVLRQRPTFVEAEVHADGARAILEWSRDSAFRFFPLVEHPELGLTLHPLDLATNKVLDAIGRLEVRDWVDLIESCRKLQPLGLLAWAACAKDPGFNPRSIVELAARAGRYSQPEVDTLSFTGRPPDAGELGRAWHAELDRARAMVPLLPAAEAGKLVLRTDGEAFRGGVDELRSALSGGALRFHAGRPRGAWPDVRPA